jgi:hypothetical protein
MLVQRKAPAGGVRAAFVAPLALAAALAACGDDDDDHGGAAAPGGGTPAVGAASAIYVGGTNDEAYRAIVGVPAVADARAASLAAPAAGATTSAASPPTFSWPAAQVIAPRPAGRSLWALAWEALVERPAHAHGRPYSGLAYLLSVTSAAGEPLLTALTPETSFTPDAASWSAVAGAGGEVRVWLLTARVEENAVVGGGPWAPPSGALALLLGP